MGVAMRSAFTAARRVVGSSRGVFPAVNAQRLMSTSTAAEPAHAPDLYPLFAGFVLGVGATQLYQPPAEPAAPKPAVPKLTLYYGDMPFWRAECVRMCLFVGGVPFEDHRQADARPSSRRKASCH